MAKSVTKRTLVGFRTANINARYFEDFGKPNYTQAAKLYR